MENEPIHVSDDEFVTGAIYAIDEARDHLRRWGKVISGKPMSPVTKAALLFAVELDGILDRLCLQTIRKESKSDPLTSNN